MKPTSIPSLLAAGLLTLAACSSATEYVPGPDSLMLAVRETVVVDTGFLYLHGNPIEPPYVFVIAGDSLYAELYINDYIADSIDKRPPDLDTVDPYTRLSYQIHDQMRQMDKNLFATKMEWAEAVADLYRAHPDVIDSVKVINPSELRVVYRDAWGRPSTTHTIIASPRPGQRPPTAYETVASRMNLLVRRLRRGWTVFNWSGFLGYYPSLPDSGFAAWVASNPAPFRQRLDNPIPLKKRRR